MREVSQAGHGRRVLRLACVQPLRRARRTRPDRPVRGPRRRPRGGAQRPPGRAVAEPLLAAYGRRRGRTRPRPARDDVAHDAVPPLRRGRGRPRPATRWPVARWRGAEATTGDVDARPCRGRHDRRGPDHAATTRGPREAPADLPEPGGRDRGDQGLRRSDRSRCGSPVGADLAAGRLVAARRPGTACPGLVGGDGAAGAQPDPGRRGADALHHHAARHPGDGARGPGWTWAGSSRPSTSRSGADRRRRPEIASSTSASARSVCAGRNASQYGSAAAIEPTSGSKPGAAARGLSQTTRRARRAARAIDGREQLGRRRCPSRPRRSPGLRRGCASPCRTARSSPRLAARCVPPYRSIDLLAGPGDRDRRRDRAGAPGSAGSARSRTRTSRPAGVRANARIRCR